MTTEEKQAFLKIDLARGSINKAKQSYEKIFKNRSEFDRQLDIATGFQQKKAQQLLRIMQFYLPIIIENQKLVGADWGDEMKILNAVNQSLVKSNE